MSTLPSPTRLPNNYSGLAHTAPPLDKADERRLWKRWLEWVPWVTHDARSHGKPLASALAEAQHRHRQRVTACLLNKLKWDTIAKRRLDDPLRQRIEFGKLLDMSVQQRDKYHPPKEEVVYHAHR